MWLASSLLRVVRLPRPDMPATAGPASLLHAAETRCPRVVCEVHSPIFSTLTPGVQKIPLTAETVLAVSGIACAGRGEGDLPERRATAQVRAVRGASPAPPGDPSRPAPP
ncbi:hypothetical protein GCM10009823_10580 [Brevibacterium salitolerans]|uniref:Uncharacterized protein n=1 Tax=Brevibacterium salitolerans TaxID=1403566 RepID=A0ABN2WHL4_9MICO